MDLEEMKRKYASVLDAVQKNNVRLDHLHVQDGKLFMQGAAPNEDCKNRIWDATTTEIRCPTPSRSSSM